MIYGRNVSVTIQTSNEDPICCGKCPYRKYVMIGLAQFQQVCYLFLVGKDNRPAALRLKNPQQDLQQSLLKALKDATVLRVKKCLSLTGHTGRK